MFEIGTGTVLRLRNFTHHGDPGNSVSYTSSKGRVCVALILGDESHDQSDPLDCEKAMNALGWYRKEEGA